MSSPYAPAGPEGAPTLQTPQPVTSPTPLSRTDPNGTLISPASIASIVVFLSLSTLAVLGGAVYWTRRRRAKSNASDERPSERAPVHDAEALAVVRPTVPVTPLQEVRWTPQIRSISGPIPDENSVRKFAVLHPKHARSPPPPIPSRPRNPFSDPSPKSAPAHAPSFSQDEPLHLDKSWRGEPDRPVTPQALAVSGMQTRSLGKHGPGPKS